MGSQNGMTRCSSQVGFVGLIESEWLETLGAIDPQVRNPKAMYAAGCVSKHLASVFAPSLPWVLQFAAVSCIHYVAAAVFTQHTLAERNGS